MGSDPENAELSKTACVAFLCIAVWAHCTARTQSTKELDTAPPPDSLVSPSPTDDDTLKWYTMFERIPGDLVRYTGETFRTENIPAMVGMAGVTGGLVATDEETWRLSHRLYQNSSFAHRASDFFEYLGDGRPQFGLAGAYAVYGFAFRDQRALRTGSELVEAILSCGTVVQVLKHVTGRQSPFLSTRSGGVWDLFPNQIEYHKHVPRFDAYPSGHIATAMTTVTVVVENYPEWTWARPVGYSIVALIGVSMANTGIHWYSDYPLGLALGYSFGMLAAHPLKAGHETQETGQKPQVTVSPMFGDNGTGVAVRVCF